jgi:hypothetical protein
MISHALRNEITVKNRQTTEKKDARHFRGKPKPEIAFTRARPAKPRPFDPDQSRRPPPLARLSP